MQQPYIVNIVGYLKILSYINSANITKANQDRKMINNLIAGESFLIENYDALLESDMDRQELGRKFSERLFTWRRIFARSWRNSI
jgi:hypothetical protein